MRYFVSMILLMAVMVSFFGCKGNKFFTGEVGSNAISSYTSDVRKINRTYAEKCGIVKRVYSARHAQLSRAKQKSEKNATHKERDIILRELLLERENDKRKVWKVYRNEELKGITLAIK